MSKHTLLRAVAVAIMFVEPALARQASDCPSVKDNAERLRCFDETSARPAPASSEFTKTDIIDLKTDIKSMDGQKIEVAGLVMSFAGGLLLTKSAFDSSPIFVDIDAVPREQRRALVERCHAQCAATLRGTIGEVMNQPGVVASAIELRRPR